MSRYIVSPHQQGTPEWHQDRLGKATGSSVSAVFATVKSGEAAGRASYRMQLVLERITKAPQGSIYMNDAMRWGVEQEPNARIEYEKKTGELVEESGFIYLPDIMAGSSPDGLISAGGRTGIFEAKCPESKNHWAYLQANEVPAAYIPQIEHNLWITGADFARFVSYDPRMPEGLRLMVVHYERDQKRIDAHAAGVLQFLKEVDRDEKLMRQMQAERLEQMAA